MAESKTPIVFYDIAFRPPYGSTNCAPNPWKTRYALNFKNVPYTTSWVSLPDITKVRKAVGAPPQRKFADGTDFYTLPMITDSTTNSILGDSFDIAVHLQKTYPDSGAGNLFPAQTLDFVASNLLLLVPLSERHGVESSLVEYEKFNNHVDAAMTLHVQLMVAGFPFDPANADEIKTEFVRRSGQSSWNDIAVHSAETREKLKESLRNELTGLAKMFERDNSGPFLLGKQASYADIIVGAWLKMMSRTLPEKEWEEVCAWHGGVFGKLYHGLEQFAQSK